MGLDMRGKKGIANSKCKPNWPTVCHARDETPKCRKTTGYEFPFGPSLPHNWPCI